MDPRDMVNLIRRDFESSRWVPYVLAAVLALGLILWLPGVVHRRSPQATPPERTVISILPDPFDVQRK